MQISSSGFEQYATYGLALLSALSNSTGHVLQRKASREEPEETQKSVRLFLDLARQPLWLAGVVGLVLGAAFQISALASGPLATVQTVTILELPFTLIGAAWFLGSKLRWRDWCYIGVMTAGIAGVVGFLNPQGGGLAPHIDTLTWGVAIGITILPIVVLYVLTGSEKSMRNAAFLGVATGICFALFAALMKGVTLQFQQGFIAVITSERIYLIYLAILAGIAGMWLLQNALHAGKLVAAQPGMTLFDPIVSITWSALVFNEQMRGGIFILLAAISGLAIAVSVFGLAKSLQFEEKDIG